MMIATIMTITAIVTKSKDEVRGGCLRAAPRQLGRLLGFTAGFPRNKRLAVPFFRLPQLLGH
jgi:hypothetical protein